MVSEIYNKRKVQRGVTKMIQGIRNLIYKDKLKDFNLLGNRRSDIGVSIGQGFQQREYKQGPHRQGES